MQTKLLYTIGYEGADLSDFLATLHACAIVQVIDVRAVPLSRKRGFSKRALTEALASKGIAYVHIKELGDPKPGREAARRGDFAAFRRIFSLHLKGKDAQAALTAAAKAAAGKLSCLICFERAHEHCHRSMVAVALSELNGFAVRHLGVRKDIGSRTGAANEYDSASAFALG